MSFESVGRSIDSLFAGTSAGEVTRSAERVSEDTAELKGEQAEFAEATVELRNALAKSGYSTFEQFQHREGFERAAKLNMKEARKNFEAAFDRLEDATEAPDALDHRAEELYETHIHLAGPEFDKAVADFRASGRSELADALVKGRRTIERDRVAMRDFDAKARAYQAEYERWQALNDGVGEELEDLLDEVHDEFNDVKDARGDLQSSIEEWQRDAREWANHTASRQHTEHSQLIDAAKRAARAAEMRTNADAAGLPAEPIFAI